MRNKREIYKVTTLLVIILLKLSCSPVDKKMEKSEASGHVVFIYEGEQDKLLYPFFIRTPNDTTYLRYKQMPLDSFRYLLFRGDLAYQEVNIQTIDTLLYREIKKKIINYNRLNLDISNYNNNFLGVVLLDSNDTIYTTLYEGEATKSFLSELIEIAKINNLNKMQEKFTYFKRIQR